jgi:hypothetical protein
MVGVEVPSGISEYGGGQAEAERAKPALPGTRERPKTTRESSGSGSREGHHKEVFSMVAATGLAAMNATFANGEVRCNASVRERAGARWNVFGNASGAGEEDATESMMFIEGGPGHGSRESHEMS